MSTWGATLLRRHPDAHNSPVVGNIATQTSEVRRKTKMGCPGPNKTSKTSERPGATNNLFLSTEVDPSWVQAGPKVAPRAPKLAPRPLKLAPKTAREAPVRSQGDPRQAPGDPGRFQEGSRVTPGSSMSPSLVPRFQKSDHVLPQIHFADRFK